VSTDDNKRRGNKQQILHCRNNPEIKYYSFKREVWLYEQKCIEKLDIVEWKTLLCQFYDVDDFRQSCLSSFVVLLPTLL
jgi:hypothetical protein